VCGRCGCEGSLLTFDIPQTALVATLDTYDFKIIIKNKNKTLLCLNPSGANLGPLGTEK
jgi:hypothetical protein